MKHVATSKKTVGLVYDVPNLLKQVGQLEHARCFPPDAMSEWESQDTIDIIHQTWQELGCDVILFPIDHLFLNKWANEALQCDVMHSLVEGFGSLAREAWIPSLCELTGIPCIGSSPFVHNLCMNKNHIKLICRQLNIPTAQSYLVRNLKDFDLIDNGFLHQAHFIKPNGEGSGMGVDANHSISNQPAHTKEILSDLLKLYPDGILLETYLPGTEYTTGIIGENKQFLPIAQIEVIDGVYGAANKSKDYLSEKITFPLLADEERKQLETDSQQLFDEIGMADMARFDWKCDQDGKPYFLEVNTLPGLSKIYSVLPLMAQEAGIEYATLFSMLLNSAYNRRKDRSFWYAKSVQHQSMVVI